MHQDVIRRVARAPSSAVAHPHFDRASFRVKGKIFARLPPDGASVVLKLPARIKAWIKESPAQSHPEANAPWPGAWNRGGWTRIALEGMEEPLMADPVRLAWTQVAPRALQG
jgi:hypothetical protein